MTVIFDFPEAKALSEILRSNGIYSIVRRDPSVAELESSSTAIVTKENSALIPKLKNTHENIRVIYFGKSDSNSVFCDLRVSSIKDLIRAFPPPESLVFIEGVALDSSGRTAEISGKVIQLTASEFSVLRCISLSGDPLSAALLSELALGEKNPPLLMTLVSNINRKSREVFDKKLIESNRGRGYSIAL